LDEHELFRVRIVEPGDLLGQHVDDERGVVGVPRDQPPALERAGLRRELAGVARASGALDQAPSQLGLVDDVALDPALLLEPAQPTDLDRDRVGAREQRRRPVGLRRGDRRGGGEGDGHYDDSEASLHASRVRRGRVAST
jgi:hypothetical protein